MASTAARSWEAMEGRSMRSVAASGATKVKRLVKTREAPAARAGSRTKVAWAGGMAPKARRKKAGRRWRRGRAAAEALAGKGGVGASVALEARVGSRVKEASRRIEEGGEATEEGAGEVVGERWGGQWGSREER